MACTALAVLVLAVLIGPFPPIASANDNHGFRASLARMRQHFNNYSAAVHHDTHRLAFLARAPTTNTTATRALQALLENGAGAYHMSVSFGTPPLTFPAILDTGSDLVWTQCAPCTECFAQPTPLYDPAGSSTFSKLPCTSPLCQSMPSPFRACNASGCVYDYRYAVGFTVGCLATEMLTVGDATFHKVTFGCSTANGGHMDNAKSSRIILA